MRKAERAKDGLPLRNRDCRRRWERKEKAERVHLQRSFVIRVSHSKPPLALGTITVGEALEATRSSAIHLEVPRKRFPQNFNRSCRSRLRQTR